MQALRAFKAGAVGYLMKNLLRTELVETIRLVQSGRKRIPHEIAEIMAEHAADDLTTARELEVLCGVANGSSNKIIASNLNISEHTIKNHLEHSFQARSERSHSCGHNCDEARHTGSLELALGSLSEAVGKCKTRDLILQYSPWT